MHPLLAARILGLSLLAAVLAASASYAAAGYYLASAAAGLLEAYRDEPRPPGGLELASIYSGAGLSPLTGVLPPWLPGELRGRPGVEAVWGEAASPARVNGTLLVARGVPGWALDLVGARIVEGRLPGPGEYTAALLGVEAARRLGAGPGDVLVVESLFSPHPLLARVVGVVEAPPPYRFEVLLGPEAGLALRGETGYTVVRVVYDPRVTGPGALLEGLPERGRGLAGALLVLVSRGLLEPPRGPPPVYAERLGFPPWVLPAAGLAGDALVALLYAPLASAVIGARRRSLWALYEQGLTWARVKAGLLAATAPLVAAGSLAGALASQLLPAPSLLGYPATVGLDPGLAALHVAVHLLVYTGGLVLAGTR